MDDKSPDEKFEKVKQKFTLRINIIFKFADARIKLFMGIGLGLSLLSGAVLPTFMFIMARVAFDLITGSFNVLIVYAMLGLALFAFVVNGLSTFMMEMVSHHQSTIFRKKFFKAILRQDMTWFTTIDTGTLVTRLEEDLVLIREALGSKITQVAMFMSMLIFSLIFAFFSEPTLAGVLMVSFPLMAGGIFFTSQSIIYSQKRSIKAYESAGSIAEESTLLVRMVRANNAEERLQTWYNRAIDYAERVVIRSSLRASAGIGFLNMSLFLMYSLGLYYGGIIARNFMEDNPGEIFQADKIIRVLMMMSTSSFMLGQIAPLLLNVSKGIHAASDLVEVIDRVPTIDSSDPSGLKDPISGHIVFKNVSFTYPNTTSKIFENLNVSFNAGETVAIVGPSGIGKSTITSLIQRFYDPDEGEIFLDGKPLKSYNIQHLRKNISIISQQPRLFSLSIYENIKFGQPELATTESIMQAAKNAYAHEFIKKFPEKYNTLAGEGGSQLSGGQMQRIAIARAMIRQPAIFLLDEATAALDVESEKLVQQAFDSLISEKKSTKIIVAHRLSTIKNAERILVFGRVNDTTQLIEEGNHQTLSEIENGVYFNMMKTQMVDIDSESTNTHEHEHISKKKSEVVSHRAMSTISTVGDSNLQETNEYSKNVSLMQRILKLLRREKAPEVLKTTRKIVFSSICSNPIPILLFFSSSIIMGLLFPSIAFFITEYIGVLTSTDIDEITSGVNTICLIALGISFVGFIAGGTQFMNLMISGQKLITKLRKLIFNHLMKQPISFYDNPQNSVGNISSILSGDINLINQGYIMNTGVLLQMVTTFLFAFIFAFVADWLFALSMIVPFLLLIPATMTRGKRLKNLAKSSEKTNVESSAFLLHESLVSINSVNSYGLQDLLYARYENLLKKEEDNPVRKAMYYALSMGVANGGIFAINALGFYVGSRSLDSHPDRGIMIARAIFLIMYASRSINQNAVFTADMKKARASELKVAELLNENHLMNIVEEEIDLSPDQFEGKIALKNLRFQYPSRDLPVYKSLTVDIEPGKMIAFVGESGAGKSTIVHLLEKFYDYTIQPNDSQDSEEFIFNLSFEEIINMITIDGIPLSKISAKSIRSMIGYVSQDPSIFNTTILENIRMGKPSASIQEVEDACKLANIHDFIMELPNQYETQAGRLGSKLSGGQKQRVAIARAIIRNPKLLLLDEATSALDAQGEATVQKALDNLLAEKSRTSIVIAHRLSTIINSDKIIVLKSEGNTGSVLAEEGTHEELIKHDGVYKRMLETASS